MAKKTSILTSLLLGAAGGAAAAVFLASETGKVVKNKVTSFAKDYQENYEEINAEFVNKAQDLGQQVVDKFDQVKTQLETGELTVDDLIQSGKEKALALKDQSLEKIDQVKEKFAESETAEVEVLSEDVFEAVEEEKVVQDDIEINL
ncbi:YtxH domain-containing protein [Streptococcus gallolyticus]|nr:YtxH domain-containing protein [Streptococcus gallolyticus]MBY5040397.1 YtxH domain-containing protein [Streptococcus gallolyticus]